MWDLPQRRGAQTHQRVCTRRAGPSVSAKFICRIVLGKKLNGIAKGRGNVHRFSSRDGFD